MPEFLSLLEGYRRFRGTAYAEQRGRYDTLAKEGQHPGLMVIGCSDSRVDPAQIFDVEPGQIFVLRNVANLVPPFEPGGGQHGVSAALEFAVTQLEVHYIVVMGHAQCGGVRAALEGSFDNAEPGEGYFIGKWMSLLQPERERLLKERPGLDAAAKARELEQDAVRVSLRNLRSFPYVREREEAGTLKLEGAYFGIAEGILYRLDRESDAFLPVPRDGGSQPQAG